MVFCNKINEEVEVAKNDARLVTYGCNQEEGIDYGETIAPVAHIEFI